MYLIGVALVVLGNYEGSLEWAAQAISTLDSRTDEEEADNSGKGLTLYPFKGIHSNFQGCVNILNATRCKDVEVSKARYLMRTTLHHNEDYEEALNCYVQVEMLILRHKTRH